MRNLALVVLAGILAPPSMLRTQSSTAAWVQVAADDSASVHVGSARIVQIDDDRRLAWIRLTYNFSQPVEDKPEVRYTSVLNRIEVDCRLQRLRLW